jgi:hypothetical protein
MKTWLAALFFLSAASGAAAVASFDSTKPRRTRKIYGADGNSFVAAVEFQSRGRTRPCAAKLPPVEAAETRLSLVMPRRGSGRVRMPLRARMPLGARLLDGLMALLGRHLAPLPPQFSAPFRRHLPEPAERRAHLLLSFRRQGFELLPTLAQQLPLFRRHGAPLREALLRTRALLRRHVQPALTALREGLLAIGGQTVPFGLMALQQLLLFRGQAAPRSRRGRRGGGLLRRRHGTLREDVSGREDQAGTNEQ